MHGGIIALASEYADRSWCCGHIYHVRHKERHSNPVFAAFSETSSGLRLYVLDLTGTGTLHGLVTVDKLKKPASKR